jgi:hypothetical protein
VFFRSTDRTGAPRTRRAGLTRWTRLGGALAISAALVASVPVATAGAAVARPAQASSAAVAASRVTLGILECVTTEDWTDGDDFLGGDIVEGDHGTLVFSNDDALYYLHYGPA